MDMINFNTLGLLFHWLKRVVCYNQSTNGLITNTLPEIKV